MTGSKRLPAAVLFCVGLIFACIMAFAGEESGTATQGNDASAAWGSDTAGAGESGVVILRKSLAGEEAMPLEEYLVGALAACMTESLPLEACKAQAVLLRTNVACAAQETGSERIYYEALNQESFSREEMYRRWDEDTDRQLAILETAVSETGGQTLAWEGRAVWLPYFALSAGKTRNPDEIWEGRSFLYLRQVSCGEDVFAAAYRQERTVTEKELQDALRRVFEAETEERLLWAEIRLRTDSAGYVTTLTWNEKEASGESFRQSLSLPSANFTMKESKSGFRIVTRGVGHGFGMSLYAAGRMAADGQDYREILRYFFPDCEIVKN